MCPTGGSRGRLACLACAVVACVAAAAGAPAYAAERPLVYVIVLDGMDGDRVDQGGAPFISSLLAGRGARATYYEESRSALIAETNPNHAAMLTGAYIDGSGVAGNGYALYSRLKPNSCEPDGPVDETKPPSLTSGENHNCLAAESIYAALERQGDPDDLLTAGIFGKPKLGAIASGHEADGQTLDADYLWAPCSSSLEGDEEYCREAATNPVTGYAASDTVVMDEIIRTIREGVPDGDGSRRPDLTFVNMPQVDSAGHAFGVGPFYDTAISAADAEIQRLVTELRSRGEWERTVLILLSDHSMDTTPQKVTVGNAFQEAGIPASSFVAIGNGSVAMVYLADRTSPDRFELLRRMRRAALRESGVAEALYREENPADGGGEHTLDGTHPGWHAAGPRTGDLFVTASPGFSFADSGETSNPFTDFALLLIGQHGAPQTRDNFFSVISGGDYVTQQQIAGERRRGFDDTLVNPGQSENVDVAPTVMGMLGLAPPADNAGRFLAEAFELDRLPGRGAPSAPPAIQVRAQGGSRSRARSYRLEWGPPGGYYDVQVSSCGRWRTLQRRSSKTSRGLRVRSGRRYRVRARSLAASGRHSSWRTVRLGRGRDRCR